MNKIILSKNIQIPEYEPYTNSNILVVGGSGTGKSRYVISNNLLEASSNFVVVDTKGQLYENTAEHLRKQGYSVVCLNLEEPSNGVGYNPFVYVQNELDILKISQLLIGPIENSPGNDPYWNEMATLLCNSLLLMIFHEADEDDKNFVSFMELVNKVEVNEEGSSGSKDSVEHLFKLLKYENPHSIAVQQYELYSRIKGSSKTNACIVSSLISKLFKLQLPEVQEMLLVDEVNILDLATKKHAIFVKTSDTDTSLSFLVEIFITQCLNVLCNYADHSEKKRLERRVTIILDDAASYFIPNVDLYLSTIRSRNIAMMLAVQSFSQLSNRYGEAMISMMDCCHHLIFLGSNSVETIDRVAMRMSIPFEEVANLKQGMCYVISKGKLSLHDYLYDVKDHPGYCNTYEYKKMNLKEEEVK